MIDRSAFRALSYGMYIVSALDGGKGFGCVVNTFQQVTSEPPRVSVALNKDNATTGAILRSGRYTVSVLGQDVSMDLLGVFGFKSSKDLDKFEGVETAYDGFGVPYVAEQCVAWFSARVIETLDVGSHIMFIGEVEECEKISSHAPLTYAYYHEVKRGKTPPKASSYTPRESVSAAVPETASPAVSVDHAVEEDSSEQKSASARAWQCEICGHIEYVDVLPDGYECPLCGQGPEMFSIIPS